MCDLPGHDHAHPHLHPPAPGTPDGFRVVVTGKGGVGKTSLTALLARLLARAGRRVLALDADPQMNLPWALGVPAETARAIRPLGRDADYVEEKTGARPGAGWGLFFRLDPDVRDVVDRHGLVGPDGVHLLVMGTVVQPAAGCLCPENALLAAVAGAVSLREGEAILMDTQAGVEHFGRALAQGFRHAVVVTDPSFNGVEVALHGARLARDLGLPAVHLVVNRARGEGDVAKVQRRIAEAGGFDFASTHVLPWDGRLLECEPDVGPLLEGGAWAEGVAALGETLVRHEEALSRCAS